MIAILFVLIMTPVGTESDNRSVTFENLSYCASKGSSVEFSCSYGYPAGAVITRTAWSKLCLREGKWTRVELSLLSSYRNRWEYLGDRQHSCNLAIRQLQENDSGYYHFRFDTDIYGWRSRTATHLLVTELKARVFPQRVRVGDKVTLECQTDCTLPSTVWFKNGHRVTKTEFQAQAEDAGKYVCADGLGSVQSQPVSLDVQYAPLNVSFEVSPTGALTEGRSVNLTCSSVANPVAERYAWFKALSRSQLQVGSGQVLRLPPVVAADAGLYYCQAWNSVGGNNSTVVLLTVENNNNIFHFMLLTGIGVKASIVLLLPLVFIWVWRCISTKKKRKHWRGYENVRRRQFNSTAQNEMLNHDYENEWPVNG